MPKRFYNSLPILVFIVLPIVLFLGAEFFGYLILNGDNLIQNYPLRLLVGEIISKGSFPLWNPYIWSGSPLLAGFNAGAFFPSTLLFALLPAHITWPISEAIVYIVTGTGLYVFLRSSYHLRISSSLLASLVFTYMGVMSSQLVHFGMVEACSLVPWILLSLEKISKTNKHNDYIKWFLLLNILFGLLFLTGSAEGMIDAGVTFFIYIVFLLWDKKTKKIRLIFTFIASLIIGLLIGSIQLVPGFSWIAYSQRARISYSYFVSGSLKLQDIPLMFLPFMQGAYQRFGFPRYLGFFNLPEVTSYIGLLPLSAFLVSFTKRFRKHSLATNWKVFQFITIVGLLFSLGGNTPLGHLLMYIPIFNKQRLLNRNLFEFDLGLAIMFSFWLEIVFETFSYKRRLFEKIITVIPGLITIILSLLLILYNKSFEKYFVPVHLTVRDITSLNPYFIYSIVLATIITIGLLVYDYFPAKKVILILGFLVILDLVGFEANQYWFAPPTTNMANGTSHLARVLANLSQGGRYAIYNPNLDDYKSSRQATQPDLNILSHVPSVQGYGSLVGGNYQAQTRAHRQDSLNPAALRGNVFNSLNLKILFSLPSYFKNPLSYKPNLVKVKNSLSKFDNKIGPYSQQTWYFGEPLYLSKIIIFPQSTLNKNLKLGIITLQGNIVWEPVRISKKGYWYVNNPQALSVGLITHNLAIAPINIYPPVIKTKKNRYFVLDGILANDVQLPHWSFVKYSKPFSFYKNSSPKGWYWFESSTGISSMPSTQQVKLLSSSGWGRQTKMRINLSKPKTLIRSVSFFPGWKVIITFPNKKSKTLPVTSSGLEQKVILPKGNYIAKWQYRPSSFYLGLDITAFGLALELGLIIFNIRKITNPKETIVHNE